ncbi:MAG: hypothetical protein ACLFVQ_11145 [Chitinispirillaceae bacterium]
MIKSAAVKRRGVLALILISGLLLFLLSCAASVKQFYPDHYYQAEGIYENRPLGFTLIYKGNWDLILDPRDMSPSNRDFARELNENGLELLYVGTTVEGFHGTRAIAANLNEPVMEYARKIRELNLADNDSDRGLTVCTDVKLPVVKWEYDRAGFRFVEYYFKVDTHNVRVAFWSTPEKFEMFAPVYEEVINSLGLGRVPGPHNSDE